MDTLTRRRLVAIGLSLSGASALPRIATAQTPPPPAKAIPDCPSKNGAIGDWYWAAWEAGTTLSAGKVTLLERGAYVGIEQGPDAGKPTSGLLRRLSGKWQLDVILSRAPSTKTATVVATGAETVTSEVPSSDFERPNPKKNLYFANIDLTPLLEGKASPANTQQLVLELREGKKTLCKFAFGTAGYAETLAKATAESQTTKAMIDSGACKKGQGADDCFLTTLCVRMIGLPDDCFELRTLRAYRDGPLTKMAEGPAIIAEYYAEAPRIVAEIKRRGERHKVLRLYVTHILLCVAFAKLGLNRLTLWRYRDMMRRLQCAYAG